MVRPRYIGTWSEPANALSVPVLPFLQLPQGQEPACADATADFTQAGNDLTQSARERRPATRRAKEICGTCPVLVGCRTYALTTRQRWGIWGGTTPREREKWAKQRPRKQNGTPMVTGKFDGIPTGELFPESAVEKVPPPQKERRKPIPTVGRGNCPGCHKNPCPLAAQGDHWVWKPHTYKTWGGDTRECGSSGVALCAAPEPVNRSYSGIPLTCPHGTPPAAADTAEVAP